MSDHHDRLHSCGPGNIIQDSTVFSEDELHDIMYSTCDTSETEEVLVSSIMQYLQTLSVQSRDEDRLASLRQLLDPDFQDPHVNRKTFQSIMKIWIARCTQDSSDIIGLSDYNEVSVNAPTENQHCSCEKTAVSGVVSDMKRVRQQLSQQNSSLLRMLAQCEEENLQPSLEITELRTKLASAQRSAVKARCLTEELEETRQMLKDAQEKASRNHISITQLTNETENLKVHIRVLEDKNKKLSCEKACTEERVSELKIINSEAETLALAVMKHKEITRKNMLMDEMKKCHVESHKIIEGLQLQLRRLQELPHQQLLRFGRHWVTPRSPCSLNPPDQREIRDAQQKLHTVQGDNRVTVVRSHRADIQCFLHSLKSEEAAHGLGSKCNEKDRLFSLHQQPAALKQQLSKVHQGVALQRPAWEEKEETDKKKQRAWEKEQKHSQTGSQSQMWDAKTLVQVKAEGEATICGEQVKVLQERPEEQSKLLPTEDAVSDMKKQVCRLHTSLKSGKECCEQTHASQGIPDHKGVDTERQEEGTTVDKPVKVPGEAGSDESGLLVSLRRIEAMVTRAMGTAELVRQSKQRVSQVREKMESITQKMEKASGRAVDFDELLEIREERPSQSTGLALTANHETDSINFKDDAVCEQKDCTEPPSSSAVFPEAPEPPPLPMNGMVTTPQ